MAINTYPEVVTKMHFKCTGNVLVARWVIALVTISLLDFHSGKRCFVSLIKME